MSRIGNKAITVPAGVELTIAEGNEVTVKGPKGSLTKTFSPLMEISVDENVITVKRPNEEKHTKQLHGTTRALLATMVEGVSTGFTKQLKVVGIGYRAALKGKTLNLIVGFSHEVNIEVPEGVTVEVPDNTTINVSGIDKQIVGQFAANVRAVKKPEPYGGKGIRYVDEVLPEYTWEQKIDDVVNNNVDVFVMGDDWKGKFDFLKDYCEVVYLPRTEGISTSKIKQDLGLGKSEA